MHMCCSKEEMHTNQLGQATRLWLCHCQTIHIRVFHITWFTFWLCFFGWFGTANLYPQIQADLGLTSVDKAIAGGCSVASTVVFRVLIGVLCDHIGPKKSYVCLLLVSAFPVAGMALVQTPTGYIVVSLLIGIVGASFVITQYHTTAMFAGKTVGTANATSAGWGNFGGGCANFFMPLLFNLFTETGGLSSSQGWRLCMIMPALSYLVMCVVYYVFTTDKPPIKGKGNVRGGMPTQAIDFDHEAAAAAAALSNKGKGGGGGGSGGDNVLRIGACDYRTWILFGGYAACFGIELTVLRFAVSYLMHQFALDQAVAGFIILCFSLCNLFARSIGGVIADLVSRFVEKSLNGRVYSLCIILFIESIFLILFALGAHETMINKLGYTIFTLIMFSLCVQAAEGATFAIVPFIQPKAIGPVSGIVGAGGNMGAMLFAFAIFTNVPTTVSYFAAWLILGVFVFLISFTTLFVRFTDEEIRSADEKMATWTEIYEGDKEKGDFQKVPTREEHENVEIQTM